MNVQLRKRHRVMWLFLGIALPLLCLQAIESIPQRPIADIPIISCPANITDCGINERHEVSDHAITINLEEKDSVSLITVHFTQPLVSAFTLAYLSDTGQVNGQATLLGAINEMGAYSFELPAGKVGTDSHIVLYDKLNANTLYSQHLNTVKK